jgi:hypothetical protein
LEAVANLYLQDLEADVLGYADITITQIITHLGTTYGQLNANDLEANRQKLTDQWNPDDELFENIWKRIRIIRAVAATGGKAISDNVTIELTLSALNKAGVYNHAIGNWYDKPEVDQTLDNFVLRINKHEKQRLRKLTAKAAGYHGANKATAVTPLAAATVPLPATALAARPPRPVFQATAFNYIIVGHMESPKIPTTPVAHAIAKARDTRMTLPLTTARAALTKSTSAGQGNNFESIPHLDRGEGSQQQ